MKKLRDFINPQTSSDLIDKTMVELLEQKFQNEKRDQYQQVLKEKYGVIRDGISPVNSNKKFWILRTIGLLILIGLLTGAWLLLNKSNLNQKTIDQSEMIFAYLDANPMIVYDNTRGEGVDTPQERTLAMNALESKDYKSALLHFDELEETTLEDLYYKSYSQLKLKNFAEARLGFLACREQLAVGETYQAESEVYLILSYLGEGNRTTARKRFDQLGNSSWERKQLEIFFE